jgi:GAF domain-containing protein
LSTNLAVASLLVVMAYTVAYFGVTQTDRVVKGRLFQWLLRGPMVASTVLAVYVLVNRVGPHFRVYDPRILPFIVISTLLLLQFLITLLRLPVERALFYGAGRRELRRLQLLEQRLLTSGDLRQFLESVLAALCDTLRSPSAFIAAIDEGGKLDYEITLGPDAPTRAAREPPPFTALRPAPVSVANPDGNPAPEAVGLFEWDDFWIMPLRSPSTEEPLGLLGLRARAAPAQLTADEAAALRLLAGRAAAALEDRRLQQEVFQAVDRLLPQIEALQRLRASAAYTGTKALTTTDSVITDADLAQLVKDALSHYWGGPKLTNSPLLRLRVVERALREHDGNAANALRAVLQEAIERLKPEGQRKFTTEWLLYNILEMKFLQNRRVRDVAMRLAVSEADLYRKQRVALEEVASAIREMEREAAERATDYEIAG